MYKRVVVKPMTEQEEEAFKAQVKIRWCKSNVAELEMMLRINKKFKQQYDCRIEVLQELINGLYKPDSKTKQFSN